MNTRIKILLVEDDQLGYLAFNRTLSKLERIIDYDLDWVNNNEDALSILKNTHYDIIFLDYFLNDDDALSLLKKLGAENHEGPYILLTANDDPDLYTIGQDYPVYDYILKDEMSPSILERTILFSLKRRETENNAKRSSEKLSFIEDNISCSVIEFKKDGTIINVNKSCANLFECAPSDLIGQNLNDNIDLNTSDMKVGANEIIVKNNSGKSFKCTAHIRTKNDPYIAIIHCQGG